MSRRWRLTALASATAVLAACGGPDSPSTLDPAGSEAHRLAGLWWVLLWMSVAVYVVVGLFIAVSLLRGRRGSRESRISDGTFIVAGGVVVPALVLSVLGVITVVVTRDLRAEPVDEAVDIHVIGHRWWWEVRYPDDGIVTANEVRVPVGRPLEIRLDSEDVVHTFWVPELAGKVDLIPGQRNLLRFTVDEAGVYRGVCAEYCGLQHARMHFLVVADEADDFDAWVADRRTTPDPPATPEAARGRDVFLRSACAGCHTVRGTTATGTLGPDLTDFGSRRTIGAVTVPNTRGHLGGWILDSQRIKPGNLMPPQFVEADELNDLIAYLESLR